MTLVDKYEAVQRQLNDALAQRALIDEKVTALRNMLQGIKFAMEAERAANSDA